MDKKSLTLPRNHNHHQQGILRNPDETPGVRQQSRPVSFYDNFREMGNGSENGNGRKFEPDSIRAEFERSKSPTTMAHCLNTTVPQNIAASSVAERHTPTRNSLRHSRMIVLNRTGSVPRRSLPPVIRFNKLATSLAGFQILVGAAICCLAIWLIIWAPNIRKRDNPYWSGLPLCLSGIVGLLLLCCFRKEYPGMPKAWFVYGFKVISVSLSTLAGAACWTASVFALIHLITLCGMTCTPANQLNATCVCTMYKNIENNATTNNGTVTQIATKTYHYVDLNCIEVDNVLTYLLIFSSAANAIGGVISLWYIYLHWASRYTYVYSKVRTKEKRPIVITNK